MRYVEKPNLPQSRVAVAAISEAAGESIKKLNSLGIETVNIKSSHFLPEPINSHADIQLLHIGSNIIFSQKEHSFACSKSDIERNGNWIIPYLQKIF